MVRLVISKCIVTWLLRCDNSVSRETICITNKVSQTLLGMILLKSNLLSKEVRLFRVLMIYYLPIYKNLPIWSDISRSNLLSSSTAPTITIWCLLKGENRFKAPVAFQWMMHQSDIMIFPMHEPATQGRDWLNESSKILNSQTDCHDWLWHLITMLFSRIHSKNHSRR